MRIRDILASKAQQAVITVQPQSTVRDLVGLLAEHNVGALVVSGDGTTVDGIVSERDVVRALHERGAGLLADPISSVMTGQVHTCVPGAGVEELARTMTQHRVRHVPVVEGGALVGIVSIGDVVKARLDELEEERAQLVDYIQTG
jgi:CBS domain-containing protein